MAEADRPINNESDGDDEMVLYKRCALNSIRFKIVYDERDLNPNVRKQNVFKPEMAHQIFGESEMIFGYKQLSIKFYYLHNSAKCFIDINKSGPIAETERDKPDDILKSLSSWLPDNYRLEKEQFIEDIKEEVHDAMFGKVIDDFIDDKSRTYKITLCDTTDEAFRAFHQRFETLIVWFIDGANYIDLTDPRWLIFYVYEESLDEETNKLIRSPVAYCTVYKFYAHPNGIRPRISQFFVLPPNQRRGIATKLYQTVFSNLQKLDNCTDISVEEPTPIFQKIRDFCDSVFIYKDLEENHVNITTQNEKQINEFVRKHKISKRQAKRVFDILECMASHKNGYSEYVKFTESIKKRLTNEIERETRGSKRVCNLQRRGVIPEPIDKKALAEGEYNKYIDSLEWPVNKLRNYIKRSA